MAKVKSGNLAKRLEVSPATVRSWADEYRKYLSDDAAPQNTGVTRRFNERDQVILATIADGRNRGFTHEQIEELLNKGETVESIPEIPTEEEQEARRQVDLVPLTELNRALDLVRTYEVERDRLQIERDKALSEKSNLQDEIARLQHEVGQLSGRLEGQNKTLLYVVIAIVVALIVGTVIGLLVMRGVG